MLPLTSQSAVGLDIDNKLNNTVSFNVFCSYYKQVRSTLYSMFSYIPEELICYEWKYSEHVYNQDDHFLHLYLSVIQTQNPPRFVPSVSTSTF